jgi:hypothetical protein
MQMFEEKYQTYLPEYIEMKNKEKDFKVQYTKEFKSFHAGILETLEDGINPHKTVSEEKALCMCRRLADSAYQRMKLSELIDYVRSAEDPPQKQHVYIESVLSGDSRRCGAFLRRSRACGTVSSLRCSL